MRGLDLLVYEALQELKGYLQTPALVHIWYPHRQDAEQSFGMSKVLVNTVHATSLLCLSVVFSLPPPPIPSLTPSLPPSEKLRGLG